MLNKGDFVQVLDEDEEGVVIEVRQGEVTIETKDGFVLTYKTTELLKVNKEQETDIRKASSASLVQSALNDKKMPPKRSFTKEKRSRKDEFVLEIDLHIEKLTKNHSQMEKFDILTLQLYGEKTVGICYYKAHSENCIYSWGRRRDFAD
jgi:phage protein D